MRSILKVILATAAVAMPAPAVLAPGAAAAADYGPNTCLNGYVWREAFVGDTVCVTPATRAQTRADNAAAERRRNSILATLSTWATPFTSTCRDEIICSTTNDGGIIHHKVIVTNVNLGRTYLGLYQSGSTKPIAWWYVAATTAPGGVGGVATFKTDRLLCGGAPNAYFRVKDLTSGRWSARKPVRTGCSTL